MFYGIHGIRNIFKDRVKVKKLGVFRNYLMDGSELPFLQLSEQICQALPHFVIATFFYIINSDNHFPITNVTMILSAGNFVTGLVTSFTIGRSIFMTLCDRDFLRTKVYTYDKDFFEGQSPERKSTPIYTYSDILNTQAQQLDTQDEFYEAPKVIQNI